MSTTRRFVLLDRDGTINVERHYLSAPEQVELQPRAAEGLRRMQILGCGLAVVTNQSGLARGYFDRATLDAIHTRLRELLAAHRVTLDGIYCCPHHPDDACACRKPLPGLVEQAVAAHGFDPREAFVVGDKACDLELGRAVGATTILVRTGYGAETQLTEAAAAADFVVDDLAQAALIVGERLRGAGPEQRIPTATAAPHGGTGR